MNFGNRDFELAERRAEEERAFGIRVATQSLTGAGAEICMDCDEPIDAARRAAVPTATRCLGCQQDFEGRT